MGRRLWLAATATIALYGFAAWMYVAAVALTAPQTLHLQLTHLAAWPRTDTFGEVSFVVSLIAFAAYRFARDAPSGDHRRPT